MCLFEIISYIFYIYFCFYSVFIISSFLTFLLFNELILIFERHACHNFNNFSFYLLFYISFFYFWMITFEGYITLYCFFSLTILFFLNRKKLDMIFVLITFFYFLLGPSDIYSVSFCIFYFQNNMPKCGFCFSHISQIVICEHFEFMV